MKESARPEIAALLVGLAKEEKKTKELQSHVTEVTRGAVSLGSGTLARALHRLRAEGLVTARDGGPAPEDIEDPDRAVRAEQERSFVLTNAGKKALQERADEIMPLADRLGKLGYKPRERRPGKPGPIPEEFPGLLPHIIVNNATEAADFYRRAFDGDEFWRDTGPDGRVWHLEMLIRGVRVAIADEFAGMKLVSPQADGNSLVLHQYVEDVDAAYKQAIEAGAESRVAPGDSYWGDRYAQVQDPFGHRWALASRLEDKTPLEQRKAAKDYREENPDIALDPPM